jgi:rhodanese-related sulfurtransferase
MKTLIAVASLSLAAPALATEPRAPAAAGAVSVAAPGVVDIQTARRLVAGGIKVVDVRTPAEFAAGHVPGAANIPLDEVERRYAEIGPPAAPVLVYCRTGRRSGLAAQALRTRGFDKVYDFQAWDLWVKSEPK